MSSAWIFVYLSAKRYMNSRLGVNILTSVRSVDESFVTLIVKLTIWLTDCVMKVFFFFIFSINFFLNIGVMVCFTHHCTYLTSSRLLLRSSLVCLVKYTEVCVSSLFVSPCLYYRMVRPFLIKFNKSLLLQIGNFWWDFGT